jgi:hypothetical protein
MDPLDQRLTDAGAAWRRTQPEPPDLDRMLLALRGRRSTIIPGRFMYAFLAGLLLVAAVAVAPGVGGALHLFQTPPPVVVPSTPAVSSPVPASPEPSPRSQEPTPTPTPTASSSEEAAARSLLDQYERALIAGNWQTAFGLLASTSLTSEAGLAEFASERSAFFATAGDRYVLGASSPVTDWASYGSTVEGADRDHAYLVEVDYPALSGNNAGFEQFVVAWDPTGAWRIWPVR